MIIVVGALIGATIAVAGLQRVTLDDLSVARWVYATNRRFTKRSEK